MNHRLFLSACVALSDGKEISCSARSTHTRAPSLRCKVRGTGVFFRLAFPLCVCAHGLFALLPPGLRSGFMTSGKDGMIALWNDDCSQLVHTYNVTSEKLADGEPRLLNSPSSIRALTVANVSTRMRICKGTRRWQVMKKRPSILSYIRPHLFVAFFFFRMPLSQPPPRATSSALPRMGPSPCWNRCAIVSHTPLKVGRLFGSCRLPSHVAVLHASFKGHAEGEVWGLCPHPTAPLVVTTSDDKTVRVWDLESHRLLAMRKLPRASRGVGISQDGSCIMIGFTDGSLMVFSFAEVSFENWVAVGAVSFCISALLNLTPHLPQLSTAAEPIASIHHRKENISDIKFSPATEEVRR